MKRFILPVVRWAVWLILLLPLASQAGESAPAGNYKNFRVAVYVVVNATQRFADPKVLQEEFDRVMSRVKFDQVYLEVYRDKNFADESTIERIKKFFADRGITVRGGLTLSAGCGKGGQFGTFDFEKPADRAECKKAVQIAARHFDTVILDDFFFYTSKSDLDIAAKGKRSWTKYRLDTMRKAARDLVLKPARAVNPGIKMIIKYPNWYEHFQGLGYDLDQEAHEFDYIYTGTETRDPYVTDQLLQQYESYEIFRYFSNIRPGGGNLGGWVDTYSTRYVDRYPEQLWDTLFAKAPEITLFNWWEMAGTWTVQPGGRDAWKGHDTSFNWDEMIKSYKPLKGVTVGPGWGRIAGYSLEKIDQVLGQLGKPIGVMCYKPYQSTGEDFLHSYLGNVGIPIELTPKYPAGAGVVLLTESAKFDPGIVGKIKKSLKAGKNIFITSGLVRALQDKGIKDIAEMEYTGRTVSIHDFINGFGAGSGSSLNDPAHDNPPILFPEIRFFTNDMWGILRGVATAKGYPIVLMNHYSEGILYVITIPENISDLYNLPRGVLTAVKSYLQQDFPVRMDSPAQVALFAYDNNSFVVESFRPDESTVTLQVAGENVKLKNLLTNRRVEAQAPPPEPKDGNKWFHDRPQGPPRTNFQVRVQPHSYMAFAVGE